MTASMMSWRWQNDPKLVGIVLARYKFVAKMLEGKGWVLEVGCGEGIGARVVRQAVSCVVGIDIDAEAIAEAQAAMMPEWPIGFIADDFMTSYSHLATYDAVYSLDVFEHIADEALFLRRMRTAAPVAIIGTPSKESQVYASATSRAGHVNCKSGPELKAAMLEHWQHVFIFSMSDEVVHTGFQPMAHYLLAIGVA